MFILDTDHLGILQRKSQPDFERLSARLANHDPTAFYVTIVSFHEQILGWNAYIARATKLEGAMRGYEKLRQILNDFQRAQVLPFDQSAANVFDDMRKQKVRIGTLDLRIAAIAVCRNMTLLTRNIRDFTRVPGLQIDDWTLE